MSFSTPPKIATGCWSEISTGNRESALLSEDFKNIDWLTRGSQKSCAVGAIVTPDCLYYGTDSDRERNFIVRLDKRSGKLAKLREIERQFLVCGQFRTGSRDFHLRRAESRLSVARVLALYQPGRRSLGADAAASERFLQSRALSIRLPGFALFVLRPS